MLAAATPLKAPAATPTVRPPAAMPLDQRERGRNFRSEVARWAPRPVRCSGTRGSAAAPPALSSITMASMAATSWARCTTLTSGSSAGRGISPSTLARANNRSWSAGSAGASDCSAAGSGSERSDGVRSSRAWAKAFARRCGVTFAITGGTSSRHDDRLPKVSGRLPSLSTSTLSSERLRAGHVHREPAVRTTSGAALGLRTKDDRTTASSKSSAGLQSVSRAAVSGRRPGAGGPACGPPGTGAS